MGGDACVIGSWPSAGAAAPRVRPPSTVAPLFRSSRRLKRFEPIGLSFADEPKRQSLARSRKYTPVSGSNRAQSGVPLNLACHAWARPGAHVALACDVDINTRAEALQACLSRARANSSWDSFCP